MNYYKKWKAFQDHKNAQGIHKAWDLVGMAFVMVIFMALWRHYDNPVWVWVGIGVNTLSVVGGIVWDVYLGGKMLEGKWEK